MCQEEKELKGIAPLETAIIYHCRKNIKDSQGLLKSIIRTEEFNEEMEKQAFDFSRREKVEICEDLLNIIEGGDVTDRVWTSSVTPELLQEIFDSLKIGLTGALEIEAW